MGNFNCRNIAWGYNETDENGEALAERAENSGMYCKLPCTFNSGRWKKGTNPDNIFVSNMIATQCTKTIDKPIPRSQHRPISCVVEPLIVP